jgi:hypothetical protein
MASNKRKGTDLVLTLDTSLATGLLLGGQKTFEYTLSENIQDVTSTESADWIETQPMGGKQFKSSAECFYLNASDASLAFDGIFNSWYNDTSLGAKFTEASGKKLSGSVWISGPQLNGGGDGKSPLTLKFSMVGVGKFTRA